MANSEWHKWWNYLTKTFRATMIKMFWKVTANTVEMNGKDKVSAEKKIYINRNNQIEILELKNTVVQSLSHFQLCKPMDCNTPGFPVLHCLSEFARTHLHWFVDAIQPSHSLSPLLVQLSIFPSIGVFSNESALCIKWPEYWSFSFSISLSSEYSGLISFRTDWFALLCCSRDSQESSPAQQFKSLNP